MSVAEISTTFSATLSTLKVELDGSFPGWEQCMCVTLARPFIISALALYSAASVYALHPRGDYLGMVTSMLGWLGVVGGVCFWIAVLRDWTGIKTGLGMLLSIAFFGVTLITRVLPKRQ
ncbi:Hypothetical Protein FCC1311_051812 [Hondaea fermentalgiana]|uniref:Uncharacterized protein n=1 Tax=Hondaea fermentalgiana TaxID=2315210 RepID=A0A2R5GDA9_9STRA|nr:Hypothetical Protein FCC1311_051812 [Hondaea fermentalgiana]|eukprot:GBG28960.1 Hypothetical Protein FCC1311_051812 [Hondaea fermentalgiana]